MYKRQDQANIAAGVQTAQINASALTAVALAPYAVQMAQIAAASAGTPAQIAALQASVGNLQTSVYDLSQSNKAITGGNVQKSDFYVNASQSAASLANTGTLTVVPEASYG